MNFKLRKVEERFANATFTHHTLETDIPPPLAQWQSLAERGYRPKCVKINPRFLQWLDIERRRATILRKLISEAANADVGFARTLRHLQNDMSTKSRKAKIYDKIANAAGELITHPLVKELNECIFAAEEAAFLAYYVNGPHKDEEMRRQRVLKARNAVEAYSPWPIVPLNIINTSNRRIRVIVDERHNLIFDDNWSKTKSPLKPSHIKAYINKQIDEFYELMKTGFDPSMLNTERRKKFMDITLSQECTKAANLSISNYLRVLEESQGIVLVECFVNHNKLAFAVHEIIDELYAPIAKLMESEHIRFSPDDTEDISEHFSSLIGGFLKTDEFQKHPLLVPLASLIYYEGVSNTSSESELIKWLGECRKALITLDFCSSTIKHNVFCIRMNNVWKTLRDRAQKNILDCSQKLRLAFHDKLIQLQQEFHRFKRILSFRSMESSQMLLNRAEVIQLCNDAIPKAVDNLSQLYSEMHELSQIIAFDSSDHELLVAIVSMRRSLPRQTADHRMFFQRRLHIFSNFVKHRQDAVQKRVQNSTEKLRYINTFSNPGEVEDYLREMETMKPLLFSLVQDLRELNCFERVVKFNPTRIPFVELMESHIDALTSLFVWAKEYRDKLDTFYKRLRIDVNVDEFRSFIEQLLEVISDLSVQLEGQKAGRHFIVQIRAEVDKVKQNLPIVDVLSCNRLKDWHWQKMSDIVGFDLKKYVDATTLEITELGINQYIGRLKPIVYVAEREGVVSDQTNFIVNYWTKATFELETIKFWNLDVPTNLQKLIADAGEHIAKLRAVYEPENKESTYFMDIEKWITDIRLLEEILTKWNTILEKWKNVAAVMEFSHVQMPKEFEQFRTCAKYWQRFGEHLKSEPRVLKLLTEKHVKCWIRLADRHLSKLIQGIQEYLEKLRSQHARLATMSNVDMLMLLSDISINKRLRIIRRAAFPLLSDIYPNHKGQICVRNFEGESVNLGTTTQMDYIKSEGSFAFVSYLAKAVNDKIVEEYKKCLHQTNSSMKVARFLSDVAQNGMQDSPFKYFLREDVVRLHLKGTDKEVPLEIDFIKASHTLGVLNVNLAYSWANGKVPFLIGKRQETRLVVRRMAQNMCCPVHIINCHARLQVDVVRRCARAATQNSMMFVFEHVSELSDGLTSALLGAMAEVNQSVCPRIVLCNTADVVDRLQTTSNIYIEKVASIAERETTPHTLAATPPSRDTMHFLPTGSRRPSIRRRQSTPKPTSLAETLSLFLRGPDTGEVGGLDIACIGPLAKETISEMAASCNATIAWVYVDTFTKGQLVSEGEYFGQPPTGYLIQRLKASWTESLAEVAKRKQPEQERRPSILRTPSRFIIFYGHHRFNLHFSFLSSLICTNDGTNTQWPQSFLTLHDGSTFSVAPDVQFILCTPTKQKEVTDMLLQYNIETLVMESSIGVSPRDIWHSQRRNFADMLEKSEYMDVVANSMEYIFLALVDKLPFHKQIDIEILLQMLKKDVAEVLPYVVPANCGEILRATMCSTGLNYLVIYYLGDVERFDDAVVQQVAVADKHIIDPGRLPGNNMSAYKLSELDFTKWVLWSDEICIPSLLEKEHGMSVIFASYPSMDRLLSFAYRQFTSTTRHFVITGPPYCGKTKLVQRFAKHVTTISENTEFAWMSSFNRFNLEKMQQTIFDIVKNKSNGKEIILVVDHFFFDEATAAFLEMYVDLKQVINNGVPVTLDENLRLILIMAEEEYDKCRDRQVFVKDFTVIPVKPPTTKELGMIFEQLLSWHFQTQTFSAEYLNIVTPMTNLALKMFMKTNWAMKQLLPAVVRLAKGTMFSFPDNAPDIDSILRLFLHELIRVVIDKCIKKRDKAIFFSTIDTVLKDECETNLTTLFPTKETMVDDDTTDFYAKKTDVVYVQPDFSLQSLMFSELAQLETMEGIPYGIVLNKAEHIRTLENLHFEFCRNHEDWQIDLAITDYVAAHCQRIMRVCRQAGEHMALAGKVGTGRYQCIKLTTFSVIGQVQHVYLDTTNAIEFERSWKTVIRQCVMQIILANQPVNVVFHLDHIIKVIPHQWIIMIKQWVQKPSLDGLLENDAILKHGDHIVNNERTLATLMQSSNVRLPGQRYCQFISLEVLKNIDQLKSLLCDRIVDFLHAIFLIPPEAMNTFNWCSIDHFPLLTSQNDLEEIGEKILSDCSYSDKKHLLETLKTVFDLTVDLPRNHSLLPTVKLWYYLCQKTMLMYNNKSTSLNKKLTLLKSALQTIRRIKHLSLSGGNVSDSELRSQYDDLDLTLLMQRRHFNEDNTALEGINQKIKEYEGQSLEIEAEIIQLQVKIDEVMAEPQKEFALSSNELAEFSSSDFKKLAAIVKPSMVIRYSTEILKRLLDPFTSKKRIVIESWPTLQAFLNQPGLVESIKLFNPSELEVAKVKLMKQSTENREMRIAKLETESKLAASICKWVLTVVVLADANLKVTTEQNECAGLWERLEKSRATLGSLRDEKDKLSQNVAIFKKNIEHIDEEMRKVRKTINYRERGSKILGVIVQFEARWSTQIHVTSTQIRNLLGNIIFDAGHQVLLLTQTPEIKRAICAKWGTILLRTAISFDQQQCSVENLLLTKIKYEWLTRPTQFNRRFRSVNSREPFPLIFDKTHAAAKSIPNIFVDCSTVTLPKNNWLDAQFLSEVQRASHAETPVIIFDVNSAPPIAWYPMLSREPEKDKGIIQINQRVCRLTPKTAFFFLTSQSYNRFPTEFLHKITPMVVDQKIQIPQSSTTEQLIATHEETALRILSEYAAVDILDSQEITEQLMFAAEILASKLQI
uniref:DHC_N2 domain-containing protein n=1 Tax=Panagrellus redivivus TaxID=6233 RepID=A0A7E4UZB5_PANRE